MTDWELRTMDVLNSWLDVCSFGAEVLTQRSKDG